MITEQGRNRPRSLTYQPFGLLYGQIPFTQVNRSFEQLAGHHHPLDLVGALVELGVVGRRQTRQELCSKALE
jgi:hypothetical protein